MDSRLLRSFRALLFRPGALTTAYLEGPRKPYISPFQLFLLANLLFFAIQSVTRDKVFSKSLASHLHGQDWSELARDQLGLSAIYLYVATGKVYGVRGLRRVITAGALIVAAGCVVLGYRFFLFVVTLYSTEGTAGP